MQVHAIFKMVLQTAAPYTTTIRTLSFLPTGSQGKKTEGTKQILQWTTGGTLFGQTNSHAITISRTARVFEMYSKHYNIKNTQLLMMINNVNDE